MIKAWTDALAACIHAFVVTIKAIWKLLRDVPKLLSSNAIEVILVAAATFLGAAVGLASLKEYGFAVVVCAVPSLIWVAKGSRWSGQGARRPFSLASIRVGLIALALSFGVAVYFGMRAWRGDSPWFPELAKMHQGPIQEPSPQPSPGQQPPTAQDKSGAETIAQVNATPVPTQLDSEPAHIPAVKRSQSFHSGPAPMQEAKPVKITENPVQPVEPIKDCDPNAVVATIPDQGQTVPEEAEKIAKKARETGNEFLKCSSNPTLCATYYRLDVMKIRTDLYNGSIGFAELDQSLDPLKSNRATTQQLNHLACVLFAVADNLDVLARKVREVKSQQPPTRQPGQHIVISNSLANPKFALSGDVGVSKERLKSLSAEAAGLYQETTECLVQWSFKSTVGSCLADRGVIGKLKALRHDLEDVDIEVNGLDEITDRLAASQELDDFRHLAAQAEAVSKAFADKAR